MGPLIVACTDFSPCSEVAVASAAEIARLRGSRVLLIHICDPPPRKERPTEIWNESAIRQLREARQRHFRDFSDNDVQYDAIPSAEPVSAICAVARNLRASMIVLGSHSRTGLSRQLLGSVAENTVRHSPCSVLVVRAPVDG